MNNTMRVILEVSFDLFYLVFIWTIVLLMTRNMHTVKHNNIAVGKKMRNAFFLLALGDTGHVGFRAIAYLIGGVSGVTDFEGAAATLVGMGSLVTSITVTLFYMIMVYVWKDRYNKKLNWFAYTLLFAGVIRLIVMFLPGNNWGSTVIPQGMGLFRNLWLMLQGFGVMGLILLNAYKTDDKPFKWIGWMIALSYAFYIPVILFVNKVPILGMLMIPKTCAYLAIALISYKSLWKKS